MKCYFDKSVHYFALFHRGSPSAAAHVSQLSGGSNGRTDQAFLLTRVFIEAGQLTEAAGAHGAPVRPLSCVCPQVDRQVALLREAVAAVHAGERLLAHVAAHVAHQRRPPAKVLAADAAAVWPFARVDLHVDAEVPPQREALPTDAAAE